MPDKSLDTLFLPQFCIACIYYARQCISTNSFRANLPPAWTLIFLAHRHPCENLTTHGHLSQHRSSPRPFVCALIS